MSFIKTPKSNEIAALMPLRMLVSKSTKNELSEVEIEVEIEVDIEVEDEIEIEIKVEVLALALALALVSPQLFQYP